MASGEAISGDLVFHHEHDWFFFSTKAWLPQRRGDDEIAASGQLRQWVRSQRLRQISLGGLREAIRANLVTFPSQVPAVPDCTDPDLQRKVVLLYFVFGWGLAKIGAGYAIPEHGARRIIERWRDFAVQFGYLQKILRVEPSFTGDARLLPLGARE